jgi:predicted metal-dependent peptidase
MAMVPVRTDQVDRMGVDRYGRLYYNPQWVESLPLDQLCAVIYHELLHLLRRHHDRLQSYPPAIANLAGDMEINDDIRSEGLTLPEGAIYPETYDLEPFQTAEYYAAEIIDEYEVEYAPGSGDGDGSRQDGDNHSQGGGGDAQQSSDRTDGQDRSGSGDSGDSHPYNGGAGQSKRIVVSVRGFGGNCGSGATGQSAPWEVPANGEVPHLTEAELESIRRQVAEEVRRYANSAKNRGDVPGHWLRWANGILSPPRIPWHLKLRSLVRSTIATVSGRTNYTYSRPSRRQSVIDDIILPGMEEPVVRPAVVVDTSGSISDEDLRLALSELRGILDATMGRISTRVYSVDAQVQAVSEVFTVRDVRRILKGGGGTDMGAGIKQAVKDNPPPDVVIVITDGFTPWPEKRPGDIPVIVCLLPNGADTCPKWASKIVME